MNKTKDDSAAELWRGRIEAQRTGELSVRAYCSANGLHEHQFYWWRRQLGLSPAVRRVRRAPTPDALRFAEVIMANGGTSIVAEPIRLRLSHGRELILPMSMPVQHVAMLVRAIEGLPAVDGVAS
jgi:transposase-like protein